MCYCEICHDRRGDSDTYKRGFPEKTYTLPIGWVRISLEVPRHKLDGLNVDRVYHVAFHGTLLNKVEDILNNGCLLAAGDVALGGIRLGERKGHFNDERKPEGFDTKQIFVSPSIKYAGHGAYASSVKWTDKRTGISYNAKVCFQVWIRPDSYAVGPQTLGKDSVIDEHFSNDELEWFTTEKPAVIPYGLLVKLESTSDGSVTAYSELLKVLGDIRPKPDEPRTDRIIDRIAERCTIC
ncbi:LOW QUALITY PROTEIN: neuralized-like protein 4 [Saccoglossus kowalevskii]